MGYTPDDPSQVGGGANDWLMYPFVGLIILCFVIGARDELPRRVKGWLIASLLAVDVVMMVAH